MGSERRAVLMLSRVFLSGMFGLFAGSWEA